MPPDFVQIAKVAPRPTDVKTYHKEIGRSLTPAGRELLLKYAKVPESEIEQHCFRIVRLYISLVDEFGLVNAASSSPAQLRMGFDIVSCYFTYIGTSGT